MISRFFKRIKLKLFLWHAKTKILKTYQEEVASYEKACFKICLKLISNTDSEFMIAPMSGKRYIRNEKFQMFITMDFGRIEITNHVFNYNIRLSQRDWERIIYVFDTETEKRRSEMEQDVNSQIKNSLYTVLERISNLS